MNDTAVACNQLGQRKGAISITIDSWHRDVFDFLQVRTSNGDDRQKAHDIFPAVSIPDVLMKQMNKETRVRDGKFYLFCPHEIRTIMGYSLEDFWGEEFEKRYWECVDNPHLPKKEVNAMDIMKEIVKSSTETGTPFLFFRDTVNRLNPNSHKGMIYSSNLCMEILQNQSPQGEVKRFSYVNDQGDDVIVEERVSGDFVVCNLSSLNLGRTHTQEDIARIVPLAIRMMDNVIDLNFYPVEEARITNKKYRAVGLGTFGYHHMLALHQIQWESQEHLEFVDDIYEMINYYAIKASSDIAKEKGRYKLFEGSDWETGLYFSKRDYTTGKKVGKTITTEQWKELEGKLKADGIRNGYLFAVAPNGSSSLYGGSTSTVDPIYSIFYLDEKKGQIVPVVAPDLSPETIWYYNKANATDQFWSIKATATRQRHIDQSQSFNIYINPEEEGLARKIIKMYYQAWKLGVKTTYYTRSLSIEVEECASCSA